MKSKVYSFIFTCLGFLFAGLIFLSLIFPGLIESNSLGTSYSYSQLICVFGGTSEIGIVFKINIYLVIAYQLVVLGSIVSLISYRSRGSLVFAMILILVGTVGIFFTKYFVGVVNGFTVSHMQMSQGPIFGFVFGMLSFVSSLCAFIVLSVSKEKALGKPKQGIDKFRGYETKKTGLFSDID